MNMYSVFLSSLSLSHSLSHGVLKSYIDCALGAHGCVRCGSFSQEPRALPCCFVWASHQLPGSLCHQPPVDATLSQTFPLPWDHCSNPQTCTRMFLVPGLKVGESHAASESPTGRSPWSIASLGWEELPPSPGLKWHELCAWPQLSQNGGWQWWLNGSGKVG